MTMLVIASEAKADIAKILNNLEEEAGTRIADDYDERFRATIEFLVDFPEAGSPRSRLGRGIRISIVYPYVLIYRYSRDDDKLTVLRVLHGRRRITREMLSR